MSHEQHPTPDVHVEFNAAGDATTIEFPAEGLTTSCPVTCVGKGLYRLGAIALGTDSAEYGDVIEADEVSSGRLRFRRVAEKSTWRGYSYILPREWFEGDCGKRFLAELDARGVYWERGFGGMLFMYVPPGIPFDAKSAIEATFPPSRR